MMVLSSVAHHRAEYQIQHCLLYTTEIEPCNVLVFGMNERKGESSLVVIKYWTFDPLRSYI